MSATCSAGPSPCNKNPAREVICDYRPDAGLRFGPHYFTTDDEIRFAVDQVAEILESGAHLQRPTAHAAY